MPITTELELRRFLSSKDVPCHEVEVLSGGTANFCWRIKTLLGRRSIIKHAEPFIRSRPQAQLPVNRMDYEYAALTTVPKLINTEDEHAYVQLPRVYHYFPEEHVLDMLDGGSNTLKESYIRGEPVNFRTVGVRVGTWLARLHNSTSETDALKLAKEKFDDSVGKTAYRYTYNGLANVLVKFGFDPELGQRINEKFGSKLATDEVCLCHGDCWPGNFLLEDQDPSIKIEDVSEQLREPVLTVADWEMVRIGNGATDVGQFAAEAWLLDRFHGKKGLLEAFLKAYLEQRPLSDSDRERVAAHFGAHIIFCPAYVEWADEKGTREVIQIGKELLEAIEQEDGDKLKEGPLATLFSAR
jgi:thiamine kinase-like enzyme